MDGFLAINLALLAVTLLVVGVIAVVIIIRVMWRTWRAKYPPPQESIDDEDWLDDADDFLLPK